MKEFSKSYWIREKAIFSNGIKAYLLTLSFSNCENRKKGELRYNSVCYLAPTTGMFTPEASKNRKYQIKQ